MLILPFALCREFNIPRQILTNWLSIKRIANSPIGDFIFFVSIFGSLWGPYLCNIEMTKIHLEKLPNDYTVD